MLDSLIRQRKAKVAVIGLGYVGLPTAVEIAKNKYQVFGIDVEQERVKSIQKGVSYILDTASEELKEVVDSGKFKVSSAFGSLKTADIVLICVPTPLDEHKIPDVSYINSAVDEIAPRLHKGQLIILESSTYPGTTREIILPRLEGRGLKAGKDFFLVFSPERVDPGNDHFKFKNISRVVGGITKRCTELGVLFYRSFVQAQVTPVSSAETAEMTKILENTFRLVNISMINELALLAGKMGIDIWEVIEAAKTKPYGFMPFYPSPRVGGHCIPLDPFYLSWKARQYGFWARFIELAGEINEQMPHYVVTRLIWALNLKKKPARGSKILVWGVAYKRNIADSRESAAYEIIPSLQKKGAMVDYFDPLIPEFQAGGKTMKSIAYSARAVKAYDAVLILTDHAFDYDKLAKDAQMVVDTRNAIQSREYKNVFPW